MSDIATALCLDRALRATKTQHDAAHECVWTSDIQVAKADSDKQMIFGWASVVEQDGAAIVDKQGDIIPVDEIEKAAYAYVRHSRRGRDMHSSDSARLIESMVFTKEKQEALGVDLKKVGWWVGFKVDDQEVWSAIKRGERPEFSIGGAAVPVEIEGKTE